MSLEGTAENSNVPILKGKITTITVPQIDKTLSKAGQSAEAKATGEAIEKVNEAVTEGVKEAKAAATAANTAAQEAKAMVKNSSATISMNAPTADHNVKAGYQLGVMWIRPNYTLHNLAFSKMAEDFVASACVVTKAGQTFTATGNGDDKVLSVALGHGSESGWLYCVVTPDAAAVSARVIAGADSIALTPGEENVIKHKYTGTGVTFEATYETANVAETGTIIIDNLTVIDETETLEQVEDGYRDVTDNTVYGFADKYAPFDGFVVGADSWSHIKDGVWRGGLTTYTGEDLVSDEIKGIFYASVTPATLLAFLLHNPVPLWENASPASSFAAQDLTNEAFGDTNAYPFLLVETSHSTEIIPNYIGKNKFLNMYYVDVIGTAWSISFRSRNFSIGEGVLTVANCNYRAWGSSFDGGATVANENLIPIKIYGVKGVIE